MDGIGVEAGVGDVEMGGIGVKARLGDGATGGIGVEAGLGDVAKVGAGVETTGGVVRAIGVAIGMAETAGFGVGIGLAPNGGAVPVVVGVEVIEGRNGVTSVFGGASGGGVDSAFIFARARSPADRSASVDQLFSTVVCAIVSLTVCGRFIPASVVRAGADMISTSPRTLAGAVVSEFTCRSRRYRSIGCRLRERISS